jgi:uncharacterized protein with PIN domain
MKFICDDNLGKLAKFLRILGFDTAFDQNCEDQILLKTASGEQRMLLTRDNNLNRKTHPFGILILNLDDPVDQLREVIIDQNLRISPDLLFQRCSLCNTVCEDVDKSKVTDEVFPYILKTQKTIKKCPSCRRFYWKGTHYNKILIKLKSAVPEENLFGRWTI